MEGVEKIIIALFAFVGFLVAGYIHATKKNAIPLVCPLEGSCDVVIHSDHSKIFGIPVELLGAAYYTLMTTVYFLFFLFPDSLPVWFPYALLIIGALAFLFSLYLTALQAFILRHWCTWCLLSASICAIMFLITVILLKEQTIMILRMMLP